MGSEADEGSIGHGGEWEASLQLYLRRNSSKCRSRSKTNGASNLGRSWALRHVPGAPPRDGPWRHG